MTVILDYSKFNIHSFKINTDECGEYL